MCNLEDESTCWQHCITGFLKVSSMCWRVRLCSYVCCFFFKKNMSTIVVSLENQPKLSHLKWFMWSLLNGGLILQSHLFHTCSLIKFHFWDINSKLLLNGIWASQPWIINWYSRHGIQFLGYQPCLGYPLVNVYITMERSTMLCSWENPLFLWPFSIANC